MVYLVIILVFLVEFDYWFGVVVGVWLVCFIIVVWIFVFWVWWVVKFFVNVFFGVIGWFVDIYSNI